MPDMFCDSEFAPAPRVDAEGLSRAAGADACRSTSKAALTDLLWLSVERGMAVATKELLFRGAQANGLSGWELRPLHVAGSPEVAALLLDFGADPAATEEEEGGTCLHTAAGHNSAGVVRELLSRGALATWTDRRERTPLHWAAESNACAAIQAILEASSECIDARDAAGQTALAVALVRGQVDGAEALLQAGADPLALDRCSRRAVHPQLWAAVLEARHQLKLQSRLPLLLWRQAVLAARAETPHATDLHSTPPASSPPSSSDAASR
ncbi:hypothetical protein FNF27_01335 [Cafeteria roenbergensis]|uniref:Uncharacterized protein n=1 Tax=Cafeteria roenbergensis TaxID=33653 RepID=A0A5A8EGI4_CAFRO|nr:hypothetical protein FNF27_01335 [Cafeteria roenbergensis]